MIKVKARYVVLFILLVLFFGGWYIAENFVFQTVPERVEKYCSEKYGGEFSWVSYINERNTENVRVSKVADSDGVVFTVERYYDVDNQLHYKDNYYAYKHENEIYELLRKSIPKTYNFSLCIENSNLLDVKDSNIDVVNFCRDSSTILSINIISDKILTKDGMSDISESLRGIARISAHVMVDGSEEQRFATDKDYNLIIR